MSHTKSQVAAEFVLIFLIGIIILLILMKFYSIKNQELNFEREKSDATKIATKFARTINVINSANENTTKTIYFPEKLNKQETYTINNSNNIIEIKWQNGYFSYPTVTGNLSIPQNQYAFNISKQNNLVQIS